MKQNKDTIAAAKKENKDLLQQLAEKSSNAATDRDKPKVTDLGPENNEELYRLQELAKDLRRRYDDYKQRAVRKTRELEAKLDSIKDLENDAVNPSEEDTPTTRLLRQLENRFDKALIKYNEAHSIQKTYQQIVKRLSDERVTFDAQLQGMDKAIKAKERDLAELVLLGHEANASKDKAKAELAEVENALHKERRDREKDLRDRREMVRQREQMNAETARMRQKREDDAAARDAAIARKKEAELRAKMGEEERRRASVAGKLDNYEDAFLRIKDATGVADIHEVVTKFMTQEDTNNNLKQLTKDGQSRVEALKEEIDQMKQKIDALKLDGAGTGASRRLVDEYESQLSEGTANNDRVKAKFERLNKVMVSMKAGTEHLVDRLEGIKTEAAPPAVTDETVVEVMAHCERKLLRAMDLVNKKGEDTLSSTLSRSFGPSSTVSAHNFRIDIFADSEDDSEDDDREEDEDGAAKVADRTQVKYEAEVALAEATGKRPPGEPSPMKSGRGAPPTPGSVKGKGSRGSRPVMA